MFINKVCASHKRFNCPKKIIGFTSPRANIRNLDALQKTTNALTENAFNAIGLIAKQPVTQTSSGHRSTLSNQGRICTRCGYMHASLRKCSAEGQLCNFCRRVGHFEKMCFKKNRRPTANPLTSKISEVEAQSGAIVSQVVGLKQFRYA